MNFNKNLLAVFLSAISITFLFYRQSLGLNLLIFEVGLISWLSATKSLPKTRIGIVCLAALGISLMATLVTHSTFSYIVHFLVVFIFVGVLNYTKVMSLVSALGLAFSSAIASQAKFIERLIRAKVKGKNMKGFLWKSRIFIIPLVIIFIFLIIYSASNPIFSDFIYEIIKAINKGFIFLFEDIEIALFLTFFVALLISNFLLLRAPNKDVILYDQNAKVVLQRIKVRRKRFFKLTALRNEYKAAIFLLVILNVLLLVLNAADIYWVWFNFEWEGQTLKQFVHEGTYLLIFSILISILIVLYFFRGNLNFYRNNRFLKFLAYAWIIQNGVLALSVVIRNSWYINYFSLAYKRIGVFIFIAITLYGLWSVFIKIRHKKTAYYLFKTNTIALLIILVISSSINWDSLIAKYNFSHSNTAFLHLEWLATLSDKALPHLSKTAGELARIETIQKQKFEDPRLVEDYPTYHKNIKKRKESFKKSWESKSILSWNLAEYLAYKKLFTP
jgi:hypothetical protein